jgi:hypothetical protein
VSGNGETEEKRNGAERNGERWLMSRAESVAAAIAAAVVAQACFLSRRQMAKGKEEVPFD